MMVLITYDVSTETSTGKTRLSRIAKICENYGQRVQNSVFECLVDPTQFAKLKGHILKTANLDKDSIRIYYLGKNWKNRVEHHGAKKTYNPEGVIMV